MEEKQNSKKPFERRYYCAICKVFTNSDNQFNQHLEGIRHRHKNTKCNMHKEQHLVKPENYEYDVYFYVPAFILVLTTTYFFCYGVVKLSA